MMSYNVVFEYTVKAGGYAGCRFIVSYEDEAHFHKMNLVPNDLHTVIAQGITEDEAQDLCSLTPEVCRLTSAIQEMCYAKNGRIDFNLANFHLQMAEVSIRQDRAHRHLHGLLPSPSFPFVEIDEEDTERNRLLSYIENTFTNSDGTIGDTALARVLINLEAINISLDQFPLQ